MKNEIEISYLPEKKSIANELLSLTPLPDLNDTITSVTNNFFSKGGFCYPKSVNVKYRDEIEGGELKQVEVSRSPSFQPEMFRFYSTHQFSLLIKNIESKELNEFDKNPTFFLLQVIAYITGFRIIPSSFWFDGKIPIKSTNNVLCSNPNPILTKAFSMWKGLTGEARNELAGFFYFYTRAPSYHWHFEQFTHDFMIFDSVFKFYKKQHPEFKYEKNKKYENFLTELGINFESQVIVDLVNARNDLFHQFKWGNGAPGLFNDGDLISKTIYFRRMLHAVLGKIISLDGDYFKNDWNCRGTMSFDVT